MEGNINYNEIDKIFFELMNPKIIKSITKEFINNYKVSFSEKILNKVTKKFFEDGFIIFKVEEKQKEYDEIGDLFFAFFINKVSEDRSRNIKKLVENINILFSKIFNLRNREFYEIPNIKPFLEAALFLKKYMDDLKIDLYNFKSEYNSYDSNIQIHIMLILLIYSLIEKMGFSGFIEWTFYNDKEQSEELLIDINYIRKERDIVADIAFLSNGEVSFDLTWNFTEKLYESYTWKTLTFIRNAFAHRTVWNDNYKFSLLPTVIHLLYVFLRILILLDSNEKN